MHHKILEKKCANERKHFCQLAIYREAKWDGHIYIYIGINNILFGIGIYRISYTHVENTHTHTCAIYCMTELNWSMTQCCRSLRTRIYTSGYTHTIDIHVSINTWCFLYENKTNTRTRIDVCSIVCVQKFCDCVIVHFCICVSIHWLVGWLVFSSFMCVVSARRRLKQK